MDRIVTVIITPRIYPKLEFVSGLHECVDDDECGLASTECHHFADCNNNDGSYTCTCKNGYKGDGDKECKIIDACGEMDRCGPHGKCFNVITTGYQSGSTKHRTTGVHRSTVLVPVQRKAHFKRTV